MFRNRSVQMKIVKDAPSEDTKTQEEHLKDYVAVATNSAEALASSVVAVIFCYMGADTIRQVAVHIAKTKIK